MQSDTIPEPKESGVDPDSIQQSNEVVVLPKLTGKGDLGQLSETIAGHFDRGVTSNSIPLLLLAARQQDNTIVDLRRERDIANDRLRQSEKELQAEKCSNATLKERIANFPSLSIATSTFQLLGGTSLGAGLSYLFSQQTAIAVTLMVIGLGLTGISIKLIADAHSRGNH